MNPSLQVADYMSAELVTVRYDASIHQAMDLMIRCEVSGLPVVDEDRKLIGMLTERDCLDAVFPSSYHRLPGGTVADSMSSDVTSIAANTAIVVAIEEFMKSPYRRFPVLDGARLVGVLSRRDALRALRDLA